MKRIPRSVLVSRPLLPSSFPSIRRPFPTFRSRTHTQTRAASLLSKNAGPVEVQHVVVRSRWFTVKKVMTYTLVGGIGVMSTLILLSALFLDDDEDDDDEAAADFSLVANKIKEANQGDAIGAEENHGTGVHGDGPGKGAAGAEDEEEDGEDDEDEDYVPDETPEGAWFIPLGPAKALPRVLYKGTDPEWQEFVKFARDQKRRDRAQKELQSIVLGALAQNPKIKQMMGSEIKFRRHWLTVDFPQGRPVEYEQFGVEWAPGYVAILYRTRPVSHVKRIERALWPEVVASSAYSTAKDLVNTQYLKAKKAFGLEEPTSTPSQLLGLPVGMQAPQNTPTPGPENESPKTTADGAKKQNSKSDSVQVDLLSVLPDYPQDPNVNEAITLFKKTLSRKWRPPPPNLTAGTVVFQGLVEYQGSNATCIIDVVAGYNVMENRFNGVRAAVRRLAPKVQRPLG